MSEGLTPVTRYPEHILLEVQMSEISRFLRIEDGRVDAEEELTKLKFVIHDRSLTSLTVTDPSGWSRQRQGNMTLFYNEFGDLVLTQFKTDSVSFIEIVGLNK